MKRIRLFFLYGLLALVAILVQSHGTPLMRSVRQNRVKATQGAVSKLMAQYAKLPLSFQPNQGQADPQVKFLSRGNGYTLFLTSSEAILALSSTSKTPTGLKIRLIGANPHVQTKGLEELPGKANYFIGNDTTKWRTNVPTYGRVRYRDIYPGVDLVYYGTRGELEHDFIVAPGVDPKVIELAFDGSDQVIINANGDLSIRVNNGEVRLQKPRVYQEAADTRQSVASKYVLKENHSIGFRVAEYDHNKPLVIDPVLSYSTYLGGSGGEFGAGVAVDGSGAAYVVGGTSSVDFPTFNPLPPGSGGSGSHIFVSKLNAAGSALIYSTYFGCGTSVPFETAAGITVDATESAYVVGQGNSEDFPTVNPISPNTGPLFLAKLEASGSSLSFSTLFGGSNGTDAHSIALDTAGNAYVVGNTGSPTFPVTTGAFQTVFGGSTDAFVVKICPGITCGALPPPVIRTAPYDFFVGCNETSQFEGLGGHASVIVVSDPSNGSIQLNVQASGITADAFGRGGVGVNYTPSFTGLVKIRALIRVGPGFDFVHATGLPKIGTAGIASIVSDVFAAAAPPVGSLSTNRFRSAIVTPIGGSLSKQHIYNPPELFAVEHLAVAVAGQQLRICAGVQSKAVSTAFPAVFALGKALYSANVLEIKITPQ